MKLPAPAAGEGFSETLARARGVARRHAEQATQRQVRASNRANADVAMKHADAAVSASGTQLAQWQEQWAEAMSAIHLAGDASEAEATARLQQLSDLTRAHGTLDRSRSEQRNARRSRSTTTNPVWPGPGSVSAARCCRPMAAA
jgi:hypothetical protein